MSMESDLIPRWAIELAYKGGWHAGKQHQVAQNVFCQAHYALDPLFWQALEEVFGWKESIGIYGDVRPTRIIRAHQFYELVLTGGDTKKFWDGFDPSL